MAKQELAVVDVAKSMNSSVDKVVKANQLMGFEKSYMIADAIEELKLALTPQYMKPIMALQGNRLGFKSDKVYNEETVKNCLIEAVLTGVQPFGNQFNIIAGNSYITKEGFGYLLSNYRGLSYNIIPQLPRIKDQSAAVVMEIEWTIDGVTNKKSIDFPIKVNQYMGADAVIGKATRKARAWLYNTITGSEIADGDVSDLRPPVVKTVINKEEERVAMLINDSESVEDLMNIKSLIDQYPELSDAYEIKFAELTENQK